MNNNNMREVLKGFMGSYAERDKSVAFSHWLQTRLLEEMPDMPKEAGEKLAAEIIEAVAQYDKTLDDLNKAVDGGQPKEEWFAERMSEACAEMPMDEADEKLQDMENNCTASNARLMSEIDESQVYEESVEEPHKSTWNKFNLKDTLYRVGKKLGLGGLAIAANAVKNKMQNQKSTGIKETIKEAFKEGLTTDPEQVKAAVAGAVKVAAVKGFEKVLPKNTPTESICDMAGVAVESAKSLFDAASGASTITKAMDKIGKASVAAGCRFGKKMLQGSLQSLPFGALIVDLLGGLLEHLSSVQFAENMYVVIRDAAIATWNGLKKTVVGRIANTAKNIFSRKKATAAECELDGKES